MSSNTPHFDANRRKWDRRSATYDQGRSWYFRFVQRRTVAAIGLKPGARFLDIGCGTGWAMRHAADLLDGNGEFYGVDLSAGMVERAQAAAAGYPSVHILQANAEDLPLDDDFFDAVICTNSFHHYPNPPVALGEFRRVLKPGGRAHIVDVATDGPLARWIDRRIKAREPEHVHFYSSAEIAALFEAAGLRYLGSPAIANPLKRHVAEKQRGSGPG